MRRTGAAVLDPCSIFTDPGILGSNETDAEDDGSNNQKENDNGFKINHKTIVTQDLKTKKAEVTPLVD